MQNLVFGIDVSSFIKAKNTFEKFRHHMLDEQDQAGAIHAFEFCYELAWKTMKRLLQKKGIYAPSPRDCFREAALNGMISDPKKWFIFIEKRNLTVHTYEAKVMHEVIEVFDEFSEATQEFIVYLEKNYAKESS